MSTELDASQNPKKWRFSWESQSQVPILKLNLFNPYIEPSSQCTALQVTLILDQSLLKVSWFESKLEVSVRVPMPRVLVDYESEIHFKALEDHIEVKLSLLLSVDHPMVSTLDSVINLSMREDDDCVVKTSVDELKPLVMDYDIECLSSMGGVHFYCRNCSTQLSTSIGTFEEMPSVNWREVADNWFDSCCCSFGGISEKMVISYAKSYTSTTGVCLLSTSSVILCKDDLVGFQIPDWSRKKDNELDFAVNSCLHKTTGSKDERVNMDDINIRLDTICSLKDNASNKINCETTSADTSSQVTLVLEDVKNLPSIDRHYIQEHNIKCCDHSISEPYEKEQDSNVVGLLENQKSFLSGFLGNAFMTRASNLSKDVQWVELLCPCCSCLLGAYPSGSSNALFNSGVHLYKCYISTCSDAGASRNVFSMYTLERMFSSQLLECAKDELSFRTVVRDVQTKRPMLQIVLINPNSWCCFGYCLSTIEKVPRIDMYPAIKLLFSDSNKSDERELRMVEEWVTKNQADEVYMLASQIKELVISLELVKNLLPPSHTLVQGFSLSSMRM